MRERAETFLLSIVAALSVLVPILDWLGLLKEAPFLAEHIPGLTLVTLGFVTAHLVFERHSKLDKIHHLLEGVSSDVGNTLGGGSFTTFRSNEELYDYVAAKMRVANHRIDDVTWGFAGGEKTDADQKAFERYLAAQADLCKRKRSLLYREVMSFPPAHHLERAERMVRRDLRNYSLRYYFMRERLPLLVFVVIDSSELVVGFYRNPVLPTTDEIRLATTQPHIVKLFQDYFETIWHGAASIKDANDVDEGAFERIKEVLAELRTRGPEQLKLQPEARGGSTLKSGVKEDPSD